MLPKANPAAVCERVGDGAVLLHRDEEIYFGLNAVAVRIWELLPPTCTSLEELCGVLSSEYPDVDPAELRDDVVDLLNQLAACGLVVTASSPQGSGDGLAVSAH